MMSADELHRSVMANLPFLIGAALVLLALTKVVVPALSSWLSCPAPARDPERTRELEEKLAAARRRQQEALEESARSGAEMQQKEELDKRRQQQAKVTRTTASDDGPSRGPPGREYTPLGGSSSSGARYRPPGFARPSCCGSR